MENQNKTHSSKHMLIMILACIVPLVLLFGAAKYFGFDSTYLVWGAILLMIGMHVWMMKGHKGGHNHA